MVSAPNLTYPTASEYCDLVSEDTLLNTFSVTRQSLELLRVQPLLLRWQMDCFVSAYSDYQLAKYILYDYIINCSVLKSGIILLNEIRKKRSNYRNHLFSLDVFLVSLLRVCNTSLLG